MGLEVSHGAEGGGYVVKAHGEVDLSTSPQLRDAILKAVASSGGAVGVDLSAVEYMDSSGVATLVEGLKATKGKGRDFALLAPAQPVMKVLQLARLETVFDIRESL